jgi:hypothetical protein
MVLNSTIITCMVCQNAMSKAVFVDTAFWISFFDPTDQKHPIAVEKIGELEKNLLLTTDAVLTEFMNYFSKTPPFSDKK